MIALGYIAAILSAIFNGSFAALSKLPKVEQANVPPIIFQFYVCLGVFITSWLVVPFLSLNHDITFCQNINQNCDGIATSLSFTPLGLVAGILLVLALYYSFEAIQEIGLSLGQGIWGGTAVLVSFLWGVIAFPNENKVHSFIMACVALLLLIIGIIGIAFCQELSKYFYTKCDSYHELEELEQEEGQEMDYGAVKAKTPILTQSINIKGICYALLVGIFGGSILVPMHYVKKEQGIAFLPSFGIGALCGASLLLFIQYGIKKRENPFTYASKSLILLSLMIGCLSGLIWNMGNVMSIIAIPRIGYAIAYPIMQCALFISGLWGIFLFHEITGKSIWIFFLSGFILIIGAILLALSVSK